MRSWACFLTFASLLALASTGCNKSQKSVKRVKVTGKVTLDGKSLTTGQITFDAANGEPPGSFEILDGQYEGLAPVGKNKVRLTATRKISMKEKMKMDGPGYDQLVEENLLPARYADGTISREVTEEGPNDFNFDLKSK